MLPKSRAEAIQVGSPVYQTGKPCKRGHTTPRETIGGECMECKTAYQREYKRIAREAIKRAKEAA